MSCREFELSITYLSKVIPTISCMIAPTLNVAHGLQSRVGYCNMKQMECKDIWMTQVFVNAQTSTLHNENDCTYTLITVPRQEHKFTNSNHITSWLSCAKDALLQLSTELVYHFYFLANI